MNMKTKNYYLMDVRLENGKKIGFIEDLLVDFEKRVVSGFAISPLSSFRRRVCVYTEDIVSSEDVLTIKKVQKYSEKEFKYYKNTNVFDCENKFIGMLEDVIFDETYKIKSYVLSGGIIRNIFHGKNIIIPEYLTLEKKRMTYDVDINEISFLSVPHRIFIKESCGEKD